MLRKLLIASAVVVALLVGAVAALPFIVTEGMIKSRLGDAVRAATGRELAINGPIQIRWWRPLAISVFDVRLSNAPWAIARHPDLLRTDRLDLDVDLWRLVSGVLAVKSFVLHRPEVHLALNREGEANWSFGPPEPSPPSNEPTNLPVSGVEIDEARIVDGLVTFEDARSDVAERAEAIDVTARLAGLDRPLTIAGGARYKGERATLDGRVANPQALVNAGVSPARVALTAPGGRVAFDGRFSQAAGPGLDGRFLLGLDAPRRLAAWLGQTLGLPDGALERVRIEGDLKGDSSRVRLDNARLDLDAIAARGRLLAELSGDRPKVSGVLGFGELDLDPYLGGGSGGGAEAPPPEAAVPDGWSDQPLDLPLPLPVDLDVDLTARSFKVAGVRAGAVGAAVVSDAEGSEANLTATGVYGGGLNGRVTVNAEEPRRFDAALNAYRIDVGPPLQTFADIGWLSGGASVEAVLTTRGDSVRDLVGNLDGVGAFLFQDGTLRGVDLEETFGVASTLLRSGPATGPGQVTNFNEAYGTYRIRRGVLSGGDLVVQAPYIRLEGTTEVDLPERTLDVYLEPQLAATDEGQGGIPDPFLGIELPVRINGPWSDIAFGLAGDRLFDDPIPDPEGLRSAVRDLVETPEGLPDDVRARLAAIKDGGVVDDASRRALERATAAGARRLEAARSAADAAAETPPEDMEQTGDPDDGTAAPDGDAVRARVLGQ